MSLFFIVHESTEDTLDSTSNLPDALRLAKEIARQGQSGDPVTVLDSEGKAARQFALLPDGSVAEQTIALQVRIAAAAAENHRTEQVASSDF